MTHPNSREALSTISRDGSRATRHDEIEVALNALGPSIPRQIAAYLGYSDLNSVRPRLTEGTGTRYETLGERIDEATGHWATIYANRKEEPRKPFCNCTFAGFLEKRPSTKRPGFVAVVCTNPIHGSPVLYGYASKDGAQ